MARSFDAPDLLGMNTVAELPSARCRGQPGSPPAAADGTIARAGAPVPRVVPSTRRRLIVGLRERDAHVVRNSRLDPDRSSVDRRVFTIAGRAIATMIHHSGHDGVLRMQATSERDGVGFRLAYIGPGFTAGRRGSFDPGCMRPRFEYGHRRARAGHPRRGSHPTRGAVPRPVRTVQAR